MDSIVLGIGLDSRLLIAVERSERTAAEAIGNLQKTIGDIPAVLSAVTVANTIEIHASELPVHGGDC